jgi:hypothetical protein
MEMVFMSNFHAGNGRPCEDAYWFYSGLAHENGMPYQSNDQGEY